MEEKPMENGRTCQLVSREMPVIVKRTPPGLRAPPPLEGGGPRRPPPPLETAPLTRVLKCDGKELTRNLVLVVGSLWRIQQ